MGQVLCPAIGEDAGFDDLLDVVSMRSGGGGQEELGVSAREPASRLGDPENSTRKWDEAINPNRRQFKIERPNLHHRTQCS